MAKSVKINYCLSLLDTVLGMAFPLITFPYVTRILSPDSIGLVQFYLNIIGYVTLITAFGIPLYGVREIAKLRDRIPDRNKLTAELLSLHFIFTFLGYLLIILSCITIGKTHENLPLYILLSLGLLFNTLGVQWFFQAVEDFAYITIRSLIVKIISLGLLFIFVDNKNDILYYGVVLICGSAGNYLFNFIRLFKYINVSDFKSLSFKKHLKPASKVYLLNLTIGIYTQLSVFLLGMVQTNADVGYYAMSQKIIAVINSVILTLATVLLPRLSNYAGNADLKEFELLGNKAISFVLAISVPICFGLIILSKPIIFIMFGPAYDPSVAILQIWAPILIIIGLSQVYGKSILYSIGYETLMTQATFIGMVTYCFVGIPGVIYFSIYGAAFGSFFAELAVTSFMMYKGRNLHPCSILKKQNINYVAASTIMALLVYLSLKISSNSAIQVIIGIIIGVITYYAVLALFKDNFIIEIKNIFVSTLNKVRNGK